MCLAFAGWVVDVPDEPVDRHPGPSSSSSSSLSLKTTAPGSENPTLLFAAGHGATRSLFRGLLSLTRRCDERVARSETWMECFLRRTMHARDDYTGLEWNGMEWAERLQASARVCPRSGAGTRRTLYRACLGLRAVASFCAEMRVQTCVWYILCENAYILKMLEIKSSNLLPNEIIK